MASTVGLEGLLEKGAGGSTVTETVRHFCEEKTNENLIQYYSYDNLYSLNRMKSERITHLSDKVESVQSVRHKMDLMGNQWASRAVVRACMQYIV